MANDLKPGLYKLTKSMENPYCEKVTHRDLMGAIRAFPAGWDWLVHYEWPRHRKGYEESPLKVGAACGGWCQDMYVNEGEHGVAMEDWDNEGIPPLLAPPEFLGALVPSKLDTYKRVRYSHKYTLPVQGIDKLDEAMRRLIETGKLKTEDLDEAMTWVVENEDAVREWPPEIDEEGLYSAAVNEVFDETGEHWID